MLSFEHDNFGAPHNSIGFSKHIMHLARFDCERDFIVHLMDIQLRPKQHMNSEELFTHSRAEWQETNTPVLWGSDMQHHP